MTTRVMVQRQKEAMAASRPRSSQMARCATPVRDEARRLHQLPGVPRSDLTQWAAKLAAGPGVAQRRSAPLSLSPVVQRKPLRPIAMTGAEPVQLMGWNWWGALGGAALGLGATVATGGLAALPTLGGLAATATGALLGRQAVIESGNVARAVGGKTRNDIGLLSGLSDYQTGPTEPGTLEGFLPGASRHKAVTDHVFQQLVGNDEAPSMDKTRKFADRQNEIELGRGAEPDAKLRNDVYVAHIMADHDMMRESARFALAMAKLYGTGGGRTEAVRGRALEMTHLWPDQNTAGSNNQAYRGWTPVAKGIPKLLAGKLGAMRGDPDQLAKALAANVGTLDNLAKKKGAYTPEETAYILRAMGQLRDVMKPEKGMVTINGAKRKGLIKRVLDQKGAKKFAGAPEVEPTGRIRISGAGKGGLGRDTPEWHDWSRGLNRKAVPLAASYYHGTPPYKIQSGKGAKGADQGSFDFLMGTSGTTLDMLNFFLAHGKSADEAARLMQVFYANWHKVAPDGNAHSQSESIGTMSQYLYGHNLKRPIMAPIQGEADIASDRKKKSYFSPLTDQDPGYLVGGRRA